MTAPGQWSLKEDESVYFWVARFEGKNVKQLGKELEEQQTSPALSTMAARESFLYRVHIEGQSAEGERRLDGITTKVRFSQHGIDSWAVYTVCPTAEEEIWQPVFDSIVLTAE